MFYVIVALWAVGCVACWLLRRVQKKVLTVTCISVPLIGAVVSWVLMNSNSKGTAIASLLASVYISVILFLSLVNYRSQHNL